MDINQGYFQHGYQAGRNSILDALKNPSEDFLKEVRNILVQEWAENKQEVWVCQQFALALEADTGKGEG